MSADITFDKEKAESRTRPAQHFRKTKSNPKSAAKWHLGQFLETLDTMSLQGLLILELLLADEAHKLLNSRVMDQMSSQVARGRESLSAVRALVFFGELWDRFPSERRTKDEAGFEARFETACVLSALHSSVPMQPGSGWVGQESWRTRHGLQEIDDKIVVELRGWTYNARPRSIVRRKYLITWRKEKRPNPKDWTQSQTKHRCDNNPLKASNQPKRYYLYKEPR